MVELHKELNRLQNENVKLKRTINALKIQIEQLESENRELRDAKKDEKDGSHADESLKARKERAAKDTQISNLIREVDELKVTDLARKRELQDLRSELNNALKQVDNFKSQIVHYELNIDRLKAKNVQLHEKLDALSSLEKAEEVGGREQAPLKAFTSLVSDGEVDVTHLTVELEAATAKIEFLENQIGKTIHESTTRVNDLQNQIQGYESFVEELKYQYQEFLDVTKLEHESFKGMYYSEYERLKKEFERHKQAQFEDKKRAAREYQTILYGMQTQFEEFRTTMSYLLLCEKDKFKSQFQNFQDQFEQEIKYIVQTKDRFYDEMLVAKDAKIMQLIEGSDLRSLIVQHQKEMEEKDRSNAKILEKMKQEQETEQKKTISVLQGENDMLEQKLEKMQTHFEHLQMKIKEHLDLVAAKNAAIEDLEQQRWREQQAFNKELQRNISTIEQLTLEKEHLRHRIVRMQLDAKGEGDHSLGSVLKRLAADSQNLAFKFEEEIDKSEVIHEENEKMTKQLSEKKKLIVQLRKNLKVRTDEYAKLTKTFEAFLNARLQSHDLKIEDLGLPPKPTTPKAVKKTVHDSYLPPVIPKIKGTKIEEIRTSSMRERDEERRRMKKMLESGMAYLENFKMLSQAFKSGTFVLPTGIHTKQLSQEQSYLTQSISLYSRLTNAQSEFLKLKHESLSNPLEDTAAIGNGLFNDQVPDASVKLYDYNPVQKHSSKGLVVSTYLAVLIGKIQHFLMTIGFYAGNYR